MYYKERKKGKRNPSRRVSFKNICTSDDKTLTTKSTGGNFLSFHICNIFENNISYLQLLFKCYTLERNFFYAKTTVKHSISVFFFTSIFIVIKHLMSPSKQQL